MLLIHCPYCEADRPEIEFLYGGEAHLTRPDPAVADDQVWRDFLFVRTNVRGVHFERWRHVHGCDRFFNAARDTVTDRFLMTYKSGVSRPNVDDIKAQRS